MPPDRLAGRAPDIVLAAGVLIANLVLAACGAAVVFFSSLSVASCGGPHVCNIGLTSVSVWIVPAVGALVTLVGAALVIARAVKRQRAWPIAVAGTVIVALAVVVALVLNIASTS